MTELRRNWSGEEIVGEDQGFEIGESPERRRDFTGE